VFGRYHKGVFGPKIKALTLRDRWGFVKTLVSVEWKHGIPRLVVHEKYEKPVKWILRGLALIGVLAGALSFSAWFEGVILAIAILGVQQFFERSLFEYTAIHVTALPSRYDPEQWLAVAFAFSSDGKAPDMVGPAFRDKSYAEEILGIMRSWNYAEPEDEHDYIRLSFILEGPDDYAMYIYPAPHRPSSDEFFGDYEKEEAKGDRRGKRLMRLAISMTFCKLFPLKNSLLATFRMRNRGQRPFFLTTFYKVEGGYSPLIDGAVLKFGYKFKNRGNLTKDDYELSHGKRFIKPKRSTKLS
jgi:hypothetical protein